jgi:hypothetical protein
LFTVPEGANTNFGSNNDFEPRIISLGGGGGSTNVPSPSEPAVQPSEPSNTSEPSNQPSEPDPATDDTPPSTVDDSDESDSDDDEEVISNSRLHPSTTTRSGRRVRPPDRMDLNAMKVKELNAIRANNSQELNKKLANQKVIAGVIKHQFISSVKWTRLKSCMMTGKLGKLLGNLHQDTYQELGTVENLGPPVFSAKANS